MNDMTMNEYQALAGRTINKGLTYEQERNHALFEMCSELGEIQSYFQKIYQGHEIDYDKLKLEVGDLLWGIAEFCTSQGWELQDVASRNIEKLRKRYPDGFDVEHSVHREKYE